MRSRISRTFAAVAALAALASPALAQFIPPHSNDPHPPANQPAYQLPNPLSRPGVGQYPNAPHSNDPHYAKTEPGISWPKAPVTSPRSGGSLFEQTLRQQRRATVRSAPLVSMERRGGAATAPLPSALKPSQRSRHGAASLEQCYRNWDAGTRMTRASWDETCRRLEGSGRIGSR